MRRTRLLVPLVMAAFAVLAAVVLLRSGSVYELRAQFVDAGGLVPGGRVQVAGRPVGKIDRIDLGDDGLAVVTLAIDDDAITPLRSGTRASIRAVGQAGLTNRFVDLAPGPDNGTPLDDGAVLPASETEGIVSLDALLSAFGPKQREDLARLVANSAQVYAGSGSRYVNDMLAKLDPAMAELSGFTRELALDQGTLRDLVQRGSVAATAVASRSGDLEEAVRNTATGLGAIADQHDALASSIEQLPPVLRDGRVTLRRTGEALESLRPALNALADLERPLGSVLQRIDSELPKGGALADQLRAQLPALNRSLNGLPPLARPAVAALRNTGAAARGLQPIARGLRLYGTDVVLGSVVALFGLTSAEYVETGHFVKANFVQSYQTLVQGPLAKLLTTGGLGLPGLSGTRTGLTRRCPGGNQPPAPDGSSPWEVGSELCSPEHDLTASANG